MILDIFFLKAVFTRHFQVDADINRNYLQHNRASVTTVANMYIQYFH